MMSSGGGVDTHGQRWCGVGQQVDPKDLGGQEGYAGGAADVIEADEPGGEDARSMVRTSPDGHAPIKSAVRAPGIGESVMPEQPPVQPPGSSWAASAVRCTAGDGGGTRD
jgi:hypothetical protein